MVIEELLKLCTCSLVFSEELKLCLYNNIDVCSETTSLHVHRFNSLLNTSLPSYTQLQFLTEHKSPCIYIHSFNSSLNTSLHAYIYIYIYIYIQLQFLTEHKSPCIYTGSWAGCEGLVPTPACSCHSPHLGSQPWPVPKATAPHECPADLQGSCGDTSRSAG